MGTKPHQLLENWVATDLRKLWPASRAAWLPVQCETPPETLFRQPYVRGAGSVAASTSTA